MRGVLFVLLLACGGPSQKQLGVLTDDGRAAVKTWCPRVEMVSETPYVTPRSEWQSIETLILHCEPEKEKAFADREYGDIVIDSKTNKLLLVNVYVRPANYDVIVERVVRPAVDEEARKALEEFRPALEVGSRGTAKDWRRGGIYLNASVEPFERPIWNLTVGYVLKPKK